MIIFYDLLIQEFDIVKLLVSLFSITVGIIMVVIYLKTDKKIPYFRGHPKKLPMAIIQYYDQGRFNNKTIWLTILDLIQKDFYSLEKVKKDEYKLKWKKENLFHFEDSNLKNYEQYLIKYINTFIIKNKSQDQSILLNELINEMKNDVQFSERLKKIYNNIQYEIRSSYGELSYFKNYIISFIILILYYFIWFPNRNLIVVGFGYSIMIILIASVLKNLKFNITGVIHIIILCFVTITLLTFLLPTFFLVKNGIWSLFIYFNPLIIILVILILKIKFYNEKQKEIIREIKGVKNFIRDFTRLKERPIDYINFVKYYYVLAETLSIKITDQEYIKTEFDDDTLETFNIFDYASTVSNVYFDKGKFF